MASNVEKLKDLFEKRSKALDGSNQLRKQKHSKQGKLVARDRIEILLDKNSFEEYDMFVTHRMTDQGMENHAYFTDGVIIGHGTIEGRLVCVYAQDATIFGGSLSETFAKKVCKILDVAMKLGVPIIGLNDSGGARIQEGLLPLGGYGDIFLRNIKASNVIPQIAVILGACAGGAVYSPSLSDFIFMTEQTSSMFVNGPKMIKSVSNESISIEKLGGATMHSSISGLSQMTGKNDKETIGFIRTLLSYLPSNYLEKAPIKPTDDPISRSESKLLDIVPTEKDQYYSMKEIITLIVDKDSFLEIHEKYAKNLIVGFGRFNGQSVGIVANNPLIYGGALDVESSKKGTRFVEFCSAFNLPIVTLVDVPGFVSKSSQEQEGIILNSSKLLYAYGEALVPKITITINKSYGIAHVIMCSKQIGSDINYAWPNAEITVAEPSVAVEVLEGRLLKKIKNNEEREDKLSEKMNEYNRKFSNPYQAAKHGYIDDIIEPELTRLKICKSLASLSTKNYNRPAKKYSL